MRRMSVTRFAAASCLKCSGNILKPYLQTPLKASVYDLKPKHWNSQFRTFSNLIRKGGTKPHANSSNQDHGFLATSIRFASNKTSNKLNQGQKSTLIYISAIGVAMVGGAYAAVPLYRIFCQATGLGGQATVGHKVEELDTMKKVDDRILTIQFNADTASSMQWSFRPQQIEIKVKPGETALAFYSAKNPTDKPIVGISTYNVIPFEAGQYFNKIQCFCFEEQRLNPHEYVDMPVFFYIDPEIVDDPKCENLNTIMLSYTFFEAKEGFEVPVPEYLKAWK